MYSMIRWLKIGYCSCCLDLACARLSDSIVGTYKNEQSENKTSATWERGQWRREKWERATALSLPSLRAFFAFLFTPFYWTTFHHYLGAWNRIPDHARLTTKSKSACCPCCIMEMNSCCSSRDVDTMFPFRSFTGLRLLVSWKLRHLLTSLKPSQTFREHDLLDDLKHFLWHRSLKHFVTLTGSFSICF